MGAGGKVLVAASAASPLGHDDALVGRLEIMHQFARFLVVERGAHGNLEDDGLSVETGAVGAHAMLAALRLVFRVVAEMNQRVVALRCLHHHVAAASAVAAGGASARHKLLAPKGHAAIAAITGLDSDFRFVDEHVKSGFLSSVACFSGR
jgi:hypothetical protein